MTSVRKIACLGLILSGAGWAGQAAALDLYGGANYLYLESSVDRPIAIPDGNPMRPDSVKRKVRTEASGDALLAHVGVWLNESFALELRGGFPSDEAGFVLDDNGARQYDDNVNEIQDFIGLYIIPRARVFSWVDAVFPIGASQMTLSMPIETDGDATNGPDEIKEVDAATYSYGIDIRWRVGSLIADEDSLVGSISINTGFMLYSNDSELESSGYNGGLQVGFSF